MSFSPLALALVSVITTGIVAGGPVDPPQGAPEPDPVSRIIVRYTDAVPTQRVDGRPWGAQCVDRAYRKRLFPSRAIGAAMFAIRLKPPVEPAVAQRIVRQIARCPGIAWAETSTVQFGPEGASMRAS